MRFLLMLFVYIAVFCTGGTALVYEVVWQRYINRVIGSESLATAIILAVFLAGLAGGYYLFGCLSSRKKKIFRLYGILEVVIGLWALLFPSCFSFINNMSLQWGFSPVLEMLWQGILVCSFLILIPTLCMGGTVPLLTRSLSRSSTGATKVHAAVYGINTLGAVLGSLLASFFLIPTYGLPETLHLTGLLNLIFGALFIFLPQELVTASVNKSHYQDSEVCEPTPRIYSQTVLYAIAFTSGFYVMTLENVFIRLTRLSFGSSSYVFSLVVAVFVFAIAVGSLIVNRMKRVGPTMLVLNQLGIVFSLLVLFWQLDILPYFAHVIRIVFQSNALGFWSYYTCVFFFLVILLVLPVAGMGATIPLVFHFSKTRLEDVGRVSGVLLSWNALGNLFGSIAGGYLLYHFVGNREIYLFAVCLVVGTTFLASLPFSRRYQYITAFLTLMVAISFISQETAFKDEQFAVGTFRKRTPEHYSFGGPRYFFDNFYKPRVVQFYEDGPENTVAVVVNSSANPQEQSSLSIIVNGKSDSNTVHDLETLKLAAHLPVLFASEIKSSLLIGLGTGVTAGELTLYNEVQTIDVAEISPTVVKALPYFSSATNDVQASQKVEIQVGDAFRILQKSNKKWDIITSEPSNPWVSGVAQLFSREFYQLVNERLAPGGMFLQWFQGYSVNAEMLGIVMNTLKESFPFVEPFHGTKKDYLLLAGQTPITKQVRDTAARRLQENEAVRLSLAKIGIHSIEELWGKRALGLRVLQNMLAKQGVETLDRPRLHYLAGKAFFTGEELSQPTMNSQLPMMMISDKLLQPNFGKKE